MAYHEAASMFIVVPILIIFFIGQHYFVCGIAMTGIQDAKL